ncbi:MAG: helix-turn-helix domain-containing protein, partial [Xanthomonadaceae bacterium]|nr:helix-turn-helix domain-containing protein [Xanthomonadaceae bacterium]
MNESLLRRLLVLLESRADGATLAEIAAALGLPPAEAERAVRLLSQEEGPGVDSQLASLPPP